MEHVVISWTQPEESLQTNQSTTMTTNDSQTDESSTEGPKPGEDLINHLKSLVGKVVLKVNADGEAANVDQEFVLVKDHSPPVNLVVQRKPEATTPSPVRGMGEELAQSESDKDAQTKTEEEKAETMLTTEHGGILKDDKQTKTEEEEKAEAITQHGSLLKDDDKQPVHPQETAATNTRYKWAFFVFCTGLLLLPLVFMVNNLRIQLSHVGTHQELMNERIALAEETNDALKNQLVGLRDVQHNELQVLKEQVGLAWRDMREQVAAGLEAHDRKRDDVLQIQELQAQAQMTKLEKNMDLTIATLENEAGLWKDQVDGLGPRLLDVERDMELAKAKLKEMLKETDMWKAQITKLEEQVKAGENEIKIQQAQGFEALQTKLEEYLGMIKAGIEEQKVEVFKEQVATLKRQLEEMKTRQAVVETLDNCTAKKVDQHPEKPSTINVKKCPESWSTWIFWTMFSLLRKACYFWGQFLLGVSETILAVVWKALTAAWNMR